MPLDVIALRAHARQVRIRQRPGREPPAEPSLRRVDSAQARWWRISASRAADPRPHQSVADGAWGGLQDSAPKAAQLALHARVDAVDAHAWRNADLAQLWLRWAAYVVPRADVDVFARGSMPRDPRLHDALEGLGDAVLSVIGDEPTDTRTVIGRLPQLGSESLIRDCCRSGKVVIRWDTRTTVLIARRDALADHDDEALRVELGRRFLHWMAPAHWSDFARWAGVSADDARSTWTALADDVATVSCDGQQRSVLTADLDAIASVSRPSGVRLLPMGDPVLFRRDRDVVAPPALAVDAAAGVTSRLVNSLTGRVLVDGDLVGAWGRTGGDVSIDPWPNLDLDRRADVEAAALGIGPALDRSIRVRWLAR